MSSSEESSSKDQAPEVPSTTPAQKTEDGQSCATSVALNISLCLIAD